MFEITEPEPVGLRFRRGFSAALPVFRRRLCRCVRPAPRLPAHGEWDPSYTPKLAAWWKANADAVQFVDPWLDELKSLRVD